MEDFLLAYIIGALCGIIATLLFILSGDRDNDIGDMH